MNIPDQIHACINSQPEPRRSDLLALHNRMLQLMPGCQLWFLDGRDDTNKVVANPNIGYGRHTMTTANGKTREFYLVGLSPNTTGISVYLMGIKDRNYLADTYGKTLGKASVGGYCIKFKKLSDINRDVLEAAILDRVKQAGS